MIFSSETLTFRVPSPTCCTAFLQMSMCVQNTQLEKMKQASIGVNQQIIDITQVKQQKIIKHMFWYSLVVGHMLYACSLSFISKTSKVTSLDPE